MSSNAAVIRELYAAFGRGDVPGVLGAFDPQIRWNETENFPYADGNPYVGPQAVLNGVFMRLVTEWDGFSVALGDVLHAGDRVVALGRYSGKFKKTGRTIDAQFAHIWTIRNGKIAAFQQYTDTAQVAAAVAG